MTDDMDQPPMTPTAPAGQADGKQPRFFDMRQFDLPSVGAPPPLPSRSSALSAAPPVTPSGTAPSMVPATPSGRHAQVPTLQLDQISAEQTRTEQSRTAQSTTGHAGYDIVVADDPTRWPAADGTTAPLLALPERDRLPAVETLCQSGRTLVVIVTRAQESAVRALAAGARSLFDARFAVVRLDRGPAVRGAAALIAQALTAAAPPSRPAAEIVERLPGLCEQLGHLVLLRSVNKVDHAAVGFGHHLFSYLPGRRLFVVQTLPEERVARITRKGDYRPTSAQFTPFTFEAALGVAVRTLGPRPVPEGLLDRLGVDVPAESLPVALSPAGYWPDPEATEVVLMPQDLETWVRGLLPPVPSSPCRWCGAPLTAAIRSCPFCADTARGAAR